MFKNKKIAIFDYSNLAKRCLFIPQVKLSDTEVDYQTWRFIIWNSLFTTCQKLKVNAVILAGDKTSWRKIIYPAYKMNRRVAREKNAEMGLEDIDWNVFNDEMRIYANDLIDNLPFQFLELDNCEADDIIATLCLNDKDNEYIIISADSDYIQLVDNDRVKRYDPLKKKILVNDQNIENWILAASLKGQGKDNIYNVLTPVNFPLRGDENGTIRKPVFSEKKVEKILFEIGLDKWLDIIGPLEVEEANKKIIEENKKRKLENKPVKILLEKNIRERFKVNKKIISFNEIPSSLNSKILDLYKNTEIKRSDNFYPFFKKMQWINALENYDLIEKYLYKLF